LFVDVGKEEVSYFRDGVVVAYVEEVEEVLKVEWKCDV
jgi:hypothetical protein